MSETITDDEITDLGDDAANAFLENLTGKTIPADEAGDDPEADDAGEANEPDPEPEADADDATETTEADPDDTEIEFKVGETATKATMRDLKAAYARANEVDARHVEVSTRLADTAAAQARADAVLERATERAAAKWAPYAKLDFLALSRDMSIDAETFAALRSEALAAQNEVSFLSQEVEAQVKARQASTSAASQAEARKTVQALENPETGIKGWSPKVYQSLMDYAVSTGADPGLPQRMTNEWAMRVLHKAYLFDQGTVSTAAKIAKVIAKPTRVLAAGGTASAPAAAAKSAMSRLKASGTAEDAGEAFFASFGIED